MYKIVVTDLAQKDLQNAVSYISNELKNKQAAINLLDLVEDSVKSLTDMPERYAFVDDEILSREGIYFTSKGWAEIRQEKAKALTSPPFRCYNL